ncbi:hypothetical protein [Metabacillus idriensis]|uniref:hypothetical protein n=1 Tax=Metabacillus idriensis TaxID=324768 RepID=UPI00174A1220|nr:hypothetical protein [Metabacillus idriensis]
MEYLGAVRIGHYIIFGCNPNPWHIRKYDKQTVIKDHPEKIGCEVYSMKKAEKIG